MGFNVFQIRGSVYNPGWQYDSNAMEFAHAREISERDNQKKSFGTYEVRKQAIRKMMLLSIDHGVLLDDTRADTQSYTTEWSLK